MNLVSELQFRNRRDVPCVISQVNCVFSFRMNAEDWGHGVVMDHHLNPVEFWSLGFHFYYYYYYTSEFYYTDFDYMGDWKVSSYTRRHPFRFFFVTSQNSNLVAPESCPASNQFPALG